jgi:hypothetical protein
MRCGFISVICGSCDIIGVWWLVSRSKIEPEIGFRLILGYTPSLGLEQAKDVLFEGSFRIAAFLKHKTACTSSCGTPW